MAPVIITLDGAVLDAVRGGGMWNSVDAGIAYVYPGWREKTCASRGATVNGFIDAGLGGLAWLAWKKTGPLGRAIIEPTLAVAAGVAQGSYIDNCEKQKAAAATKK